MSQNIKYWKRRFGNSDAKAEPYGREFDLRPIDDLNDEGLAYLLTPVKGVNMLNLNETEITNKSIKLLTRLEYVKELSVKGCDVDNDCITDLNKIPGLELLHVKNTSITPDGLLQLTNLTNLKKLLFSTDGVEADKEKIMQLQAMLPGCNFIIDGKPYYVENT